MVVEGDPTGDVSAVAWKLLTALATIGSIAIGWLVKRLTSKEEEIKELHAGRLQDRKDFEAQTNVMLQNIYRKKGGNASDS